MSEKQAEHTNAGIKERDALTFKLRKRSRTHDHTLIAAEGELRDLQQRLVHEESAVNSLKSAVTNAEVVPSELMDRLNTRVRLGALREQATRQIMGDLQNAVSGVRASEKYSESEQWRVYLGWAQDLATIEQQIAAQDAAVAHAEQKIKEEHAAMHQNLQMSEHGLLEELTQLRSERDRSWIDIMGARKDAYALHPELLRRDERNVSSRRNRPWLKSILRVVENENQSLVVKLGDQRSFVEQLNPALQKSEVETKKKSRNFRKARVLLRHLIHSGGITDKRY